MSINLRRTDKLLWLAACIHRLTATALLAAFSLAAAGCVENRTTVADEPLPPATNSVANTNTNSNLASTPRYSNTPVTLPMVDAMLSDQAFADRVRGELQVPDEQFQKLKDAARDAVLNLDENENEDSGRSTTAAAKKAEQKIREILGGDKANSFFSLVRQEAAGDNAAGLESKPNSVPTDTRIVVNAPAYRMDIFENGQLKKTYRIGIGYPEFPLPSGLRKADTIIFNPTWTPPDEPWVKGKFKAGKTVEAGSKDNPLGPIKIPIGLPNLIHGAKSASRIGTFASHGCVGLTDPQMRDFVMQLSSLNGPQMTEAELKQYLADKADTKNVKLGSAVPVELRYETLVAEDGKLTIYRDVYERGTNTEENLKKTLEAAGVSLDDLDPALRAKILDGLKAMASDASGEPVDDDQGNKRESNTSGKVTRNIKGKKELEFAIPQLKGKGYPAPVNVMTS